MPIFLSFLRTFTLNASGATNINVEGADWPSL